MALLEDVRKLLAPLRARVASLVAVGLVKLVDDTTVRQILQVEVSEGEILDEVERFQGYGLASHPPDYAEALIMFPGGDRSHGIAIVDASAGRPELQPGEVALYTDEDTDLPATRHAIHMATGRMVNLMGAVVNAGDPDNTAPLATLADLEALKSAVAAADIVPMDGGAALKTAIGGWTPTGTTVLKGE
jgi:phage gp45-like